MQLAESDPGVLAVLSAPTEIRDYRATLPGFWRSILLTLRFRACQGITPPAQPSPEAFFFFESQHCDYKLSSYTRGFYTLVLLGSRSEERHSCVLEKVAVGDFAVAPGVARNELEPKATDRRSVSFLPSSPVPIFPQIYRKQTAVWGQLQRES